VSVFGFWVSWLAEYQFTRTRQHASVLNGTMSGLFLSHHFVTGFSYFF